MTIFLVYSKAPTRDFFTNMVKKAIASEQTKRDDEDDDEFEKRKNKWQHILNCVVFIVTKDDWVRVRDFGDPEKGSIIKDEWLSEKKDSPFEYFL